MADVHDRTTRSYNMSRIRSKNTKPEMTVRKLLFAAGFRFRLHDRRLPGKPDIVLARYQTAVFVNGCFWHGHSNCKYFVLPKSRTDWWQNKIAVNQIKDAENIRKLTAIGWKVIEIFECQLKSDKIDKTIALLSQQLRATVAP